MLPKDVVSYFVIAFSVDKVNWGLQMKQAKSLLSKYTGNQIKYAIDYYKDRGEMLYSLGYLLFKDNMKNPLSLYHAEMNMQEGGESGERNRQRVIRQAVQTKYGTESVSYLFESSRKDN